MKLGRGGVEGLSEDGERRVVRVKRDDRAGMLKVKRTVITNIFHLSRLRGKAWGLRCKFQEKYLKNSGDPRRPVETLNNRF